MLRIKRISEVVGKHVYTADGDYFGQVEEVNLVDNKIEGWRIRVGSGLSSLYGGARGVVIPHQFVKSIGDVFVITKVNVPTKEDSQLPMDVSNPGMNKDFI